MTEEETIKLAEKLLVASYAAPWTANHTAEQSVLYAFDQAYAFRNAVNKLKAKEEPQQTP